MTAIKRIELKQVCGLWRIRLEYGAGSSYELLCPRLPEAVATVALLVEQDEAYEEQTEQLRRELTRGERDHDTLATG